MTTCLGEALRAVAKEVWNIDIQIQDNDSRFLTDFVIATGVTEPAASNLLTTLTALHCTCT